MRDDAFAEIYPVRIHCSIRVVNWATPVIACKESPYLISTRILTAINAAVDYADARVQSRRRRVSTADVDVVLSEAGLFRPRIPRPFDTLRDTNATSADDGAND